MRTNVAYLFDRMPAESWPFQRFWLDYPRKMDKAAATRAWARLTQADREACLRRLPMFVAYWQRTDTLRKFIPYPATFINGRRWEDEIENEEAAATDLGQCFWNRNGTREPGRGQCTERAVVTNPENGQCYCGAHGRSLGLKVKAA